MKARVFHFERRTEGTLCHTPGSAVCTTNFWDHVDCRRCLAMRPQYGNNPRISEEIASATCAGKHRPGMHGVKCGKTRFVGEEEDREE